MSDRRNHELFARVLADHHYQEPREEFVRWAQWHRLAPFMYASDPSRWTSLARSYFEAEAEDLARSSWLSAFHKGCEERGVRLVFFKGVGVARLAFDSPGLRPLGDVDVLVERNALDGAMEVARGMGFRELYADPAIRRYLVEKHYQVPMIHERFGLLELHFDLYREVGTGWLEGALRRAIPMDLYGARSWVLRPEDLFPVLAVHLCHTDGRVVWIWLLDLVLLDRIVDPTVVISGAREQGTVAALAVGQKLARTLWGREILGGRDLSAELTRLESWAVLHSRADDASFHGSRVRMAQRSRASPQALMEEALRYLWPSPGALALEFGGSAPMLPRAAFALRRLGRTFQAAGAGVAGLSRLRGRGSTATVRE